MPAARIDVTVLENNNADKTDISGVGYLYPSWKTEVYSRDGLRHGRTRRTISTRRTTRSTSRPPRVRRRAGAVRRRSPSGHRRLGRHADGLQRVPLSTACTTTGSFAWEYSFHPNADSKCLSRRRYRAVRSVVPPAAVRHELGVGVHGRDGEANVNYVPGLGMYFDNLYPEQEPQQRAATSKASTRSARRKIETVAKYPYQPPTGPDQVGDPVKFTVHNLFKKTLTVYSKGVDANGITSNSVAKIVLAHAQDIDGSPLAYEEICWMADKNAEGFRVFAGDLPAPTADDPDAVITLDPGHALLDDGQGPVGHRPPVHLHRLQRQLGYRGLQLEQDERRRHRRVRERGPAPRHVRELRSPVGRCHHER